MSGSAVVLALTTAPDAATAEQLARTLVEAALAACVNIVPLQRSIYRWQGRIHADAEVLLLIKTTTARFAELKARLPALHPYEVPELLAVAASDGLPAYLDWVSAMVESAP